MSNHDHHIPKEEARLQIFFREASASGLPPPLFTQFTGFFPGTKQCTVQATMMLRDIGSRTTQSGAGEAVGLLSPGKSPPNRAVLAVASFKAAISEAVKKRPPLPLGLEQA